MAKFEIKDSIGKGGQARVKDAVHVETREQVALKIFKKKTMNLFALSSAHMEHSIM